MTTPESHEATQIVSNLEAIRTIVSEKNHMGRMTNLKEALSEKMIIQKTSPVNHHGMTLTTNNVNFR